MGFAQSEVETITAAILTGAGNMGEGIANELDGIDLGDKRLNERSVKVIEALAADPQASINAAHGNWSDTQAAYRLFDNPAVTPGAILQPHADATLRRIAEQPLVLIAQDTTELCYSAHPPADARRLDKTWRLGFYHHVQLALTPDRVPLGLVGADNHDRDPEVLGGGERRAHDPIEEKESFRWLRGYRRACEIAALCPGTRVVSVADAEADIYDIFLEAAGATGPKADYIVRAHEPRSTPELDRDISRRTYRKVREVVDASPVLDRYELELDPTPKREARTATFELRAVAVTVKPPNSRPGLAAITHHMLLVQETGGPGDGTDVEWLLATTLPIDTPGERRRVVDHYKARWSIETFFKVLKTGCGVEEIRLETTARLHNCVAMYDVIAWRVLRLTHLARTRPDAPATEVFADHEWKPLWGVVRKKPLPEKTSSLGEVMKLVAALGGYNNRKGERPAGPQPIWTGLRRLLDFSTAWLAFGPESGNRCV